MLRFPSCCVALCLGTHTHTQKHFTSLFSGLPRWAGARSYPSGFYGARGDIRCRHTNNLAGRHSIVTNRPPTSLIPHFYAVCASCRNPPNLSWLGTCTKYSGLHTQWLALCLGNRLEKSENFMMTEGWSAWSKHVCSKQGGTKYKQPSSWSPSQGDTDCYFVKCWPTFYSQTRQKVWGKGTIKDPVTPWLCCCTTLWNMLHIC